MDIERIRKMLAPIIFRLKWQSGRYPCYGTGFFISSDGLALTAFHNLPESVLQHPDTPIEAEFQGKRIVLRWKLPDETWQRGLEIAVLEGHPEMPIPVP